MKILIHSDEYYPTPQACAYRMGILADTFARLGDEVTVITSSANKENGQSGDWNTRIEKIIYAPTISMKKKTTLMRLLNNCIFGISSILFSFFTGKADVVITTSPPPLISIPGYIIAKIKRAKLVYDVRDIWPDVALEMGSFSESSIYCRVFRWIAKFMYKHADLVTTVSPGKVEKIRAYIDDQNRNPKRVRYVGNGFDESILMNEMDSEIISKFRLDEKPACVYIGNIGLAQGLDALLKLAAETSHKEMQFLCFGRGAEKEFLEKKAKEENLNNVHFCGVLPHDKVFTLLNKAKISFIPLKNSNMKDSIPTKVYEALGIGCPVLLMAEGDSCSIVKEAGLGECVSPDEQEKLAETFDSMLLHYEKYEQQKEGSKLLMCEKYSRQHIAEEFHHYLHKLYEE